MRNQARKICAALVLAAVAAAAASPACGQSTAPAPAASTKAKAVLSPPSSAAGAFFGRRSFRLVGDAEAVWLVVREGPAGYKLAVKPAEKPWQVVGPGRRGNIAAAAGVGGDLVVFFAGGGHMRYSPDRPDGYPGVKPPRNLWPGGARVLAACAAGDGTQAVLVLVARPVLPASESQTTKSRPAASAPASASARELAVLRYAGRQWRQIAVVPAGPSDRAYLAVNHKTVYVLTAGRRGTVLTAFEKETWRSIGLPAPAASTRPAEAGPPEPLAMMAIDGALVLVTFDAHSGGAGIARYESGKWRQIEQPQPKGPPSGHFQPVLRDQQAVTWPADAAPAVGRLAAKIAFAWKQNDEWLFATCTLDGQLSPDEPLNAFAKASVEDLIDKVQQVFFWTVFGVIVMLMFWPGQPIRTAPFSLPPTMFPAGLRKRLVAGCIDTMPLLAVITAAVFAIERVDVRSLLTPEGIKDVASSLGMLYVILAFMVVYPTYCFIMEYRYSATLGKMVMHLRVVGDGGRPVSLREAALRNISKITEFLGLILVFPILFPILTRYRQRLGDKISWTTVIDADLSLPPEAPGGAEAGKPEKEN